MTKTFQFQPRIDGFLSLSINQMATTETMIDEFLFLSQIKKLVIYEQYIRLKFRNIFS